MPSMQHHISAHLHPLHSPMPSMEHLSSPWPSAQSYAIHGAAQLTCIICTVLCPPWSTTAHLHPPHGPMSYFLFQGSDPQSKPWQTQAHWSRPLSLSPVLFPKNIKAVTWLLPALGSQRNDLAWSHYSASWTQARKSQWKILAGDWRKERRGKNMAL